MTQSMSVVVNDTCNLIETPMANVVSYVSDDNEDSGSSVIEIESPKKPEPQIIDLADEEIVINVTDAPVPKIPLVSQCNKKAEISVKKCDDDEDEDEDGGESDCDAFVDAITLDEAIFSGSSDDESGEEDYIEISEAEGSDYEYNFFGKLKNIKKKNDEEEKVKVTNGDKKGTEDNDKKEKHEMSYKNEKQEMSNKKRKHEMSDEKEKQEMSDKKEKHEMSDEKEKHEISDKKDNKDECHGERFTSLTRKNEAKQDNQNKIDNQAQPKASGSQSMSSFFKKPRIPGSYSQPWYTSSADLLKKQEKKNESKGHHPNHWTPGMVKFYDEDWGNENEFVMEKLQAKMDKNPSLWEISPKDVAFWKGKSKKLLRVRCFNCLTYGHESYNCKEKKRTPKCHMCGMPGHIAYKCPQAICLNCGTSTTGYVTKCKNCTFSLDKVCERCHLTGHLFSECTDHWRLYHSTVGTVQVKQPREEIYKPSRNIWCCNCGRRGHVQVHCGYCVKNSDFSDTLPFVTSYIKAFTRNQLSYGYEDPSKQQRLIVSMEDNIMTNPSQKHVFHRKTSQVRNQLRALKRHMLRRGNSAVSYRNIHLGELGTLGGTRGPLRRVLI